MDKSAAPERRGDRRGARHVVLEARKTLAGLARILTLTAFTKESLPSQERASRSDSVLVRERRSAGNQDRSAVGRIGVALCGELRVEVLAHIDGS